jgi:hypothetical protein
MLRRLPVLGIKTTLHLPARLLLHSKNRIFYRLGDSEFDNGLSWNLDFLLRLWIEADASLPLLLHQFAKTGQDKFAVLFDLFVREVAERVEEYSGGSFVGLRGSSECNLKFSFGHVQPLFMAGNGTISRESQFLALHLP